MIPEGPTGERRAPDLEAAIARAPEERGGYLVYADWLQQQGEPRGELIVVQHALAAAPNDAALHVRELVLFEEHGAIFLGPLAAAPDSRSDWSCGFVRSLEFSAHLGGGEPARLASLLVHPSLQFLRRLTAHVEPDTDLALLAERAPPTLRWLELFGPPAPFAALRTHLARRPLRLLGVEHLQINARTYRGVADWLTDAAG